MASERANPRMAYEKSCCLREGLRAYPIMRDPKTDPIPAPDPATPTVAAPAPMNLAAESMSLRATEVERVRLATETGVFMVACVAQMEEARGLWYCARTFFEQLVAMIRANILNVLSGFLVN